MFKTTLSYFSCSPWKSDMTARTFHTFLTGEQTGRPGAPGHAANTRAHWSWSWYPSLTVLFTPAPPPSCEWTSGDSVPIEPQGHSGIPSLDDHSASSLANPSDVTQQGAPTPAFELQEFHKQGCRVLTVYPGSASFLYWGFHRVFEPLCTPASSLGQTRMLNSCDEDARKLWRSRVP